MVEGRSSPGGWSFRKLVCDSVPRGPGPAVLGEGTGPTLRLPLAAHSGVMSRACGTHTGDVEVLAGQGGQEERPVQQPMAVEGFPGYQGAAPRVPMFTRGSDRRQEPQRRVHNHGAFAGELGGPPGAQLRLLRGRQL